MLSCSVRSCLGSVCASGASATAVAAPVAVPRFPLAFGCLLIFSPFLPGTEPRTKGSPPIRRGSVRLRISRSECRNPLPAASTGLCGAEQYGWQTLLGRTLVHFLLNAKFCRRQYRDSARMRRPLESHSLERKPD